MRLRGGRDRFDRGAKDEYPFSMEYRRLGRTGISVSEIGFGAWGIGGMWGPRNDETAVKALHRALDLGVTFIDTALAYGDGHSERLIARVFRERKARVTAATKIPPKNWRWPASHRIPLRDVFPPSWVRECTEKSLKNLDTGGLDLQQFHVWSDTWMDGPDFPAWREELSSLTREGKVKYFGVSVNDHDPDSALRIAASGLIATVQVIYNIFDQSPEKNLFPLCRKLGIGVIARVPLDEGSLSGTFTTKTTFPQGDWRREYFTGQRLRETVERVEKLRPLFDKEGLSLPIGALKFCLSHPIVSTVIPGMRRPEHAEANVPASDGKPLPAPLLNELGNHAWPRNFYE